MKLERKALGALTTIDVHARDVVETMINAGISSPNNFEWSRELRYYWQPYAERKNLEKMAKAENASQKD